MPATSIRDLIVKDDDIAVGTHGRSFWILDDATPLRQITAATASAPATLFKPAMAYRFRWSKYPDTPIPPDEPWAENPPDGAIVDYYVGAGTAGDATLEVVEPSGRVIRRYSSRDTSMAPEDVGNTPRYWIRRTKVLQSTPGFHRFVWDLHYAPPAGTSSQPGEYPISATPHDTPREPRGPWALPGQYTARLTVGGNAYTQAFTVKMDPRIKTPAAAIAAEHALAVALFDDIARDSAIVESARGLRSRLAEARAKSNDARLSADIDAYDSRVLSIAGGVAGRAGRGGRGRGAASQTTLASLNGELLSLMAALEEADAEPTSATLGAVHAVQRDFDSLAARWTTAIGPELAGLNARLRGAGQQPVSVGR
jgi:hypothetical protein